MSIRNFLIKKIGSHIILFNTITKTGEFKLLVGNLLTGRQIEIEYADIYFHNGYLWLIRLINDQFIMVNYRTRSLSRIYDNIIIEDNYIWYIDKKTYKMGLLDYNGNELTDAIYSCLFELQFADSVLPNKKAIICIRDGKSGIIDPRTGIEVIPATYEYIIGICKDQIIVKDFNKRLGKYKYGAIDFNNKIITPLMYDDYAIIDNNMQYYEYDGRCGLIDRKDNHHEFSKCDTVNDLFYTIYNGEIMYRFRNTILNEHQMKNFITCVFNSNTITHEYFKAIHMVKTKINHNQKYRIV